MKIAKFALIIPVIILTFIFFKNNLLPLKGQTGAPPYLEEDLNPPENSSGLLSNWVRPDGPAKVGLQVGHWKNNELPEELERLRGNTGSKGGGKSESEVNMKIAELTAELLKKKGVEVDILPSTVPSRYWADVFVAIHADGSLDLTKSGFKASGPRRDFSGNSKNLLAFVEKRYQEATGMIIDPNVTRNMRGYYAFAWWRYDHSIHPMTTALILETGFLTSPEDRRILIGNPHKSAEGLANGLIEYLTSEDLL